MKDKMPSGAMKMDPPAGMKPRHTGMQKAMAQKRLLGAVKNSWTPGRRNSTMKKMPMKPPKGMM